jgi:hypothetical protein
LGVAPGRYLGLVGQNRWQTGEAFLSSFEPGLNISGLVSWLRDYLSLVLLSWLPDLGRLLGLAALLVVLLSVVWLVYGYFRRRVLAEGLKEWQGGKLPLKNLPPVQVFYQAVHWSFYRSAIWLLTDDPYLGMLGGIVLVGGEWLLASRPAGLASGWPAHPRVPLAQYSKGMDSSPPGRARHSLRSLRSLEWEERLLDASVLIATFVIFFFVPNLWLLLPVHWLLALASRRAATWDRWSGFIKWPERPIPP